MYFGEENWVILYILNMAGSKLKILITGQKGKVIIARHYILAGCSEKHCGGVLGIICLMDVGAHCRSSPPEA
jgi:hypothetical protein